MNRTDKSGKVQSAGRVVTMYLCIRHRAFVVFGYLSMSHSTALQGTLTENCPSSPLKDHQKPSDDVRWNSKYLLPTA